jgi:hypothetical protein
MKQIFTLFTGIILLSGSKAQVVLNELYTDPGAGKHEFFELYNNSSSSLPMSLAGYSVITYFEGSGNEKGFYVLDLPDLIVPAKGYFVGSAAIPLNYQGVSGSLKTHFSWNDLTFLNLNNGYLKKWVVGTAVPASVDGNASYDEQPVPAKFNDFLSRRSGSGASYSVFVYKNGNLVNAFFGGSNSRTVPAFITSMPRLRLKLAGIPNEANINFNNISGSATEHVIADAGSDNGFIRHKDGLCAAWGKSSAQVQHTPCETNGSIFGALSSISLMSNVIRAASPSEFSTVSYKLLAADDAALPLILDLYIDNGTKMTELDSKDHYLLSDTIYTVSDTVYQQKFKPYDADIIIAVKAAPGCYGKIFAALVINSLLPLNILEVKGSVENTAVNLEWKVSDNQKGNVFEVQKSLDGANFQAVGLIMASEKEGIEDYFFKGISQTEATAYYRLKIQNGSHPVTYTKIIQLRNTTLSVGKTIRLSNNPVESYLGFTYQSQAGNSTDISIYDLNGKKLYTVKQTTQKGTNTFTLNMGGRINAGIYLLEVRNGSERTTAKFIKR